MNLRYDLTGQKFGRLTVISLSNIKKSRKLYWNCICDCGNTTLVSGSNLRAGKVISCGCAHSKSQLEDLTGQRFGKLIVLQLDEQQQFARTHWICKCDCGGIISVAATHLKNNKITHCGCEKIISYGEDKIKKILINNNLSFQQHKYINLDNKKYFFDFFVENKYFIEYDGKQHFQATNTKNSWNTTENLLKTQQNDLIKNNYCIDNNIPLIRIPYTHFKNICLEDLLLETSQFILKNNKKEEI